MNVRLLGLLMIVAGAAIAVVFAGGLVVFAWVEVANLIAGSANPNRFLSVVLMGPIVGLAPALLGLVLARNGWRRLRPLRETEEDATDE